MQVLEHGRFYILSISFLVICFSLLPKNAGATTADPAPIEFIQPDGTSLSILLKGDEFIHWATTLDGYTILSNTQGFYEYASIDTAGNLRFSGS